MTDHRRSTAKRTPRCAFCGSEEDTTTNLTRDHVPPRGIFFEPLPSDLITVDACPRCNTGASKDDEQFRVLVSLDVGADTPELREWWSGPVLRGIRRNRKLHGELLENMRRTEVRTPAGLYLGEQTVTQMKAAPYKRTLVKITRGLYFHHYGEALPPDTPVAPCRFELSLEEVLETLNQLTRARVGDGKQF